MNLLLLNFVQVLFSLVDYIISDRKDLHMTKNIENTGPLLFSLLSGITIKKMFLLNICSFSLLYHVISFLISPKKSFHCQYIQRGLVNIALFFLNIKTHLYKMIFAHISHFLFGINIRFYC